MLWQYDVPFKIFQDSILCYIQLTSKLSPLFKQSAFKYFNVLDISAADVIDILAANVTDTAASDIIDIAASDVTDPAASEVINL